MQIHTPYLFRDHSVHHSGTLLLSSQGLSIYLVSEGVHVAAAYLGWAVLAILLHTLLLYLYIKQARRLAQDHPRQQLLVRPPFPAPCPLCPCTCTRTVKGH